MRMRMRMVLYPGCLGGGYRYADAASEAFVVRGVRLRL